MSRGDSIKYYNIEGAVALMATLIINICVICVFSAGVHGRPEEEDIGLANAGEFLGRRYGKSMASRAGGGADGGGDLGIQEEGVHTPAIVDLCALSLPCILLRGPLLGC